MADCLAKNFGGQSRRPITKNLRIRQIASAFGQSLLINYINKFIFGPYTDTVVFVMKFLTLFRLAILGTQLIPLKNHFYLRENLRKV